MSLIREGCLVTARGGSLGGGSARGGLIGMSHVMSLIMEGCQVIARAALERAAKGGWVEREEAPLEVAPLAPLEKALLEMAPLE